MTGTKAIEGAGSGYGVGGRRGEVTTAQEGGVMGVCCCANATLIGDFRVRVGSVTHTQEWENRRWEKVKPRTVEGFEASVPLPDRQSQKEQHMNSTYIHRYKAPGGAF